MGKELPKGWVETTLGESFKIERGGSPRPIENYITENENGINWIKIGDTKNVNKFIFSTKEKIKPEGIKNSRMVFEDDFILSNSMSFGRPYIMKTTGCIHDGWLVIRKNENVDNNFLYYLLSSNIVYKQFSDLAKGSTVKNLNIQAVQKVKINLPPLNSQLQIAEKLDQIFSHLETAKKSLGKMPVLLKQFRQAVLTQAVTGKLTDSKVEERLLGELLIDVKYGTSKKSEYETDGSPIFRIPNIKDGEIDDVDLKFSILDDKEFKQLKLEKGDLLVIRSNGSISLVGKTAIIREKHVGYSYAGYLIRLRPGNEIVPEFLNYTMMSNFLRNQIVSKSHSSSGVNNINSQELKDLKVLLPSLKKQTEIVRRVETLFAKADIIEAQYKILKEKIDNLPQAVLAKAFRGEKL